MNRLDETNKKLMAEYLGLEKEIRSFLAGRPACKITFAEGQEFHSFDRLVLDKTNAVMAALGGIIDVRILP